MIEFGTEFYFVLVMALFLLFQVSKVSKRTVLFVINLIFLLGVFYYRKKHFLVLIGILIFNFGVLKFMGKAKVKRYWMWLAIFADLLFLAFFKYELIRGQIVEFLPWTNSLLKPLVFIGISFLTFKLIHVAVDQAHGAIKKLNFLDYFNFLTFFPCFLSGPFDRYQRFVKDTYNNDRLSAKETYDAIYRIVQGLFKKLVVANSLLPFTLLQLNVVDLPHLSSWEILFSLYMYSVVLYFDFSGYTDMAIGISQLFKVQTPENFNRPYLSTSVQDFWNRWHMSFVDWLKDYLYFPISRFAYGIGLRNFNVISPIGFFITFALAGIWHGDGSHFVYYGLYHGFGLAMVMVYKNSLKSYLSEENLKRYDSSKVVRFVAIFVTLNYVTFSWFFFLNKGVAFSLLLERIF